jgi:hypothetical protein
MKCSTPTGRLTNRVFVLKGIIMAAGNGYFRQAVASFDARPPTGPGQSARAALARPDLPDVAPARPRAGGVARPAGTTGKILARQTNATQLNIIAAAAYFQKNEFRARNALLETEIALHPTTTICSMYAVQAYLARGLFTNALGRH